MKLGLVSDIHGNRVALDAVLDDMPVVDALVCCGDIIGYNPWPAECVDRIRSEADVVVQGNHDRDFRTPDQYRGHDQAYEGLLHAQDRLSDEQAEWISSLPQQTTAFDGTVRVVHSHPETVDAYVPPRQFTAMGSYLDGDERALVMGHTHIQHAVDMSRYQGEGLIVNPGSVGQPRDRDPRAAYAVLDTESWDVELHRVEYDIETVQAEVSRVGLPVGTGRRLDDGE